MSTSRREASLWMLFALAAWLLALPAPAASVSLTTSMPSVHLQPQAQEEQHAVYLPLLQGSSRGGTTPPANRPPVAQDGSVTTEQGTPASAQLTATDPDGNPLTYRVVTVPSGGMLSGMAPDLSYTPNPDYSGSDRLTFVANDGKIDSNIATITFSITASGSPTPTSSPTPSPTPTLSPTPSPTPPTPPPATGGLWISAEELSKLPMSGLAWDRMKAAADGDLGIPTLADYNANHDVRTLAVGLVYARTGDAHYRGKAAEAIRVAIGKEEGGLVIMLARNLVSYIITADLINLKLYDPALDGQFREWISMVRYKQFTDGTLISEHERRSNNHGTMPGASRAAIAVYLEDAQELARTAQVFKGWVGDRTAYAGFDWPYGVTWQSDPNNPVAINPVGGMKNGELIDGAMPEEMRRGCEFQYPPCPTGYPWEGLQGALVQANILSRQGYDVWNWQDQALLRAVKYVDGLEKRYGGWWAAGDDTWVPWFVNHIYGTSYSTTKANIGKNMGWTDWMYDP